MNNKEHLIRVLHKIYRRAGKLNLYAKNCNIDPNRIETELLEIKAIIDSYLADNSFISKK